MAEHVARLRLRNLPFGVGPKEVRSFLGLPASQSVEMIHHRGRPSGHAWVFLSDQQEALNLKEEKHQQRLNHRGRAFRIDVLPDFPPPKIMYEELEPGDVRTTKLVQELRYKMTKDCGNGPWRVDLMAPSDVRNG